MSDKKYNILFLEDNLVSSHLVVTTLSRELPEVKFITAITIKEARQKIAAQKFDLFILDIQLPDGNSIDFLTELKREHVSLPRAIFMTASKLPELRQRAQSAGAVRFFEKPFKMKDFARLIRELLNEAPVAQTSELAFEGSLSSLTPMDLVQLKCLSMATIGLQFTTPTGNTGVVYFRNGLVFHSTCGDLTGEAAFCRILSWKGGKIGEVPVTPELPRTITANWTDLLMRAAQMIDEGAGG